MLRPWYDDCIEYSIDGTIKSRWISARKETMSEPTKPAAVKAVEDLVAENETLKKDLGNALSARDMALLTRDEARDNERDLRERLAGVLGISSMTSYAGFVTAIQGLRDNVTLNGKEVVRLQGVLQNTIADRNAAQAERDEFAKRAAETGANALRLRSQLDEMQRRERDLREQCRSLEDQLDASQASLLTASKACAKAEAERNAVIGTVPLLNLAEVGKRAHKNCFKRGFHKPGAMRPYIKRVAHVCEEMAETLLAIDNGNHPRDSRDGKPAGVLDECADAIIIISEIAYQYATEFVGARRPGQTLDAAVADKLTYNDARTDGTNGNSV